MKKIFSFLLAAAMLFLVACSKPASSLGLGSSEPASSSSEVISLNPATLTGLERGSDYPEDRRLTAVMVNNIDVARPTRGLTEAEMLVEIQVEGGITRFMALYADYENIPQVGTFRSARDQFFQLILPYQALYAHVGESTKMGEYFRNYEYDDYNIDGNTDSSFWWIADRPGYSNQEYRAYTSGEKIADYIKKHDLDDERTYNSTIFHFVPYDEPARTLTGEEVDSFTVTHSQSYRTSFDYSSADGRYMMSQHNSSKGATQPTIDENNNKQLGFDNVIVIFAPMAPYPGDSGGVMKVNYGDGGFGYYFNNGNHELIRWAKGSPQDALKLFDADGNEIPVELNPGTTYLGVVDDARQEAFVNQIDEITTPAGNSSTSSSSVSKN